MSQRCSYPHQRRTLARYYLACCGIVGLVVGPVVSSAFALCCHHHHVTPCSIRDNSDRASDGWPASFASHGRGRCHRSSSLYLMVPQPPTRPLPHTESPLTDTLVSDSANRSTVSRQPDERPAFNRSRYYVTVTAQVAGLVLWCLAVACLYITWEDVAATHTWPSRHRTLLTLQESEWGMSTVHGMGFGRPEREFLLQLSSSSSEPLLNGETTEMDASSIVEDEDRLATRFMNRLPSYNEVLLRHRTETVVQWQTVPTTQDLSEAIHVVVGAVARLPTLADLARDYQWSQLRAQLQSPLWTTDLSRAASI
jgi:hypothetical protein